MAEASALPPGVTALDDAACARLLPLRGARDHKGSHGKLLLVAGSLDFLGAALLAALAAARAGAGLVRLAVPASLQPLVAGRVPEVITMGLPETEVDGEVDPEAALERILDTDHDALVVGPGLRPGLATVELVGALLAPGAREHLAPALLDAEALNSLSTLPDGWQRAPRPCALTPHVGEFARLRTGAADGEAIEGVDLAGDDQARAEAAGAAARAWRQVVVLKGARTVVAAPDGRLAQAPFENPALASAGTGDVLSGTIGSLLAQGLDVFEACCLGVYLHGVAGEAVRERMGDAGLLASDLPDEVARARRRLSRLRDQLGAERRLGFRVGPTAG
ncbi:MAG TPA: NAD(P)H-hydrate dehydratase [Candidatus Limnocylindrales bacterium]|nr:NAD(P)H-hydrate dehydratase [Candidatus Limnocylindrales bacterium]